MKKHGTDRGLVVLQPRDRRIIAALATLRFVDREQACAIGPFHSDTRAKARLLLLVNAGYLARFFVGTIRGGRRAIYCLPNSRKTRRTTRLVSSAQTERFVEHQLAVNSVYLELIKAGDDRPIVLRWERVTAPLPTKGGVLPDAYLEVGMADMKYGMLVEIDLSTESLSIWKRKVAAYLGLARSGDFQNRFGLPTFRVLVLAETEGRIRAIRSMIALQTDRVFCLARTTIIKSGGFWSNEWLRPSGDQRYSLIERKDVHEILPGLPPP